MAIRAALVMAAGRLREFVLGDSLALGHAQLNTSALTAARTFTLPDQAGTIALTSDIAGGGVSLAVARKTVSLRI